MPFGTSTFDVHLYVRLKKLVKSELKKLEGQKNKEQSKHKELRLIACIDRAKTKGPTITCGACGEEEHNKRSNACPLKAAQG